MRTQNYFLLVLMATSLFNINTLLHAQEHPGILLPGSGHQQNQNSLQAAQRTSVPQGQQIFIDDDSLHSAAMYQVIERVTHLTFTGGTATGDQISLEGTTPTGNISLHQDPAPDYCCPTCVSNAFLELRFHLGGDKHTYEQGKWGAGYIQINIQVTLKNGGNVVYTPDPIQLQLTQTNVEKVFRMNLEQYHQWFCGTEASVTANNIEVTVTGFTNLGGTPPTEFVRLDADVHEEYKVSVNGCSEGSKAVVIPRLAHDEDDNYFCFLPSSDPGVRPFGLPVIQGNPVKFAWSVPNECPDKFPSYQIQIVRLYNTDPIYSNNPYVINAKIDWNQALTLLVEGGKQNISLTLPENIGYYAWRVRPIGNAYGGITHPMDWGKWSEAPPQGMQFIDADYFPLTPGVALDDPMEFGVFYYDPVSVNRYGVAWPDHITAPTFVHDKNWSYSRAFTEDDTREPKIFESITYTDRLGQPEQQQAVSSADDILQTQQYVYDYTGRPSTQLMPAPVKLVEVSAPHLHLNYIPELATNVLGDAYGPADVDAAHSGDPAQIPATSLSHTYYSNDNPDISVPDANGYPFSQSRYYPDGRVKEVSGVGTEHRLNDGETSKLYYSGATESELVSVFGAEAPDPSSVSKVVTIDPDNVASVQYINKEGQTIATCLVNNGELDGTDPVTQDNIVTQVGNYSVITGDKNIALLNLKGEKVNELEINDDITGGEYVASSTFSKGKSYTILKPTTIKLEYKIIPPIMIVNGCEKLCLDCMNNVRIQIRNRETNEVIHTFYPTIGPPTPLCGPNGPNPQPANPGDYFTDTYTFPPNAPPGTYIVERIVEDKSPQPSFESYLGTPVPTLNEIYNQLFDPSISWPLHTAPDYQSKLQLKLKYFNDTYGNEPNTATNFYPHSNDPWFANNNLSCERLWLLKQICERDLCIPIEETPTTQAIPIDLDFELYLFKELSNNPSLTASQVIGNADYNLNIFFRRWDTGGEKFPVVSGYYTVYGRGMFNQIITNMLNPDPIKNPNLCVYDCKKLWEAWRLAVAEYKIARADGTLTTMQNGIYFDLLENFLDKAGRKLRQIIPPLNYSVATLQQQLNFYDLDDGYLRKPYKLLPINTIDNDCYRFSDFHGDFGALDGCPTQASLDLPSNANYKIFDQPKLWAVYESFRKCEIGKQLKLKDNKFMKDKGLKCDPPTVAFDMNSQEWIDFIDCMEMVGYQTQETCSTRCEQRREVFRQIILENYRNPNPPPPVVNPGPKYLVGSIRPASLLGTNAGLMVTQNDHDKLLSSELECKVDALMKDCQSFCYVPNIKFDRTTGQPLSLPSAGADHEYGIRLIGNPEVDVHAGECFNGGQGSGHGYCLDGFHNYCNTTSQLTLIATYLNSAYRELSKGLTKAVNGDFGELVRNYLNTHGITVPPCFDVNGQAYNDLQNIIIKPADNGRFEVISIPGCGCYLKFTSEELIQSESAHPWISELNSYFNDVWGMKLTTPGVMSPDSSNTSSLNPNGYYTMMPYNSGDSTVVFYSAIEDRASQLVDRLRFYDVNGRTDSSRAFVKLHTLDSIGAGPTTLGVVLTNLRDIIHVSNPTDSMRNDTWRSYNIGLSLPVPSSTLISGKGFNFSIHGAGKTGINLDSIGFAHSPSYSGLTGSSTLTLQSPDTEYRYPSADATEVTTIAAAPEVVGAAKFTDIIGRFEQTPDGYLAYRDLKTNDLYKYEYVRFTQMVSQLIGDENCIQLCNEVKCSICIRWKEDMDTPDPHDPTTYRSISCEERKINEIKRLVAEQYNSILKKHRELFNVAYKEGCRSGNIQDVLKVSYNEKLYHYTLYYYDRNSNLVQTVPPKGVDIPMTGAVRTRLNGLLPYLPDHALRAPGATTPAYSSTYAFNTLKLPIEENTVDGGMTQFAYSPQRLLRFSQNARQATPNGENHKFSYTNYDQLGRVIESGEFSIASTTTFANIQSQALTLGLNALPTGATRTYYTQTFYSTAGTLPAPYTASSQRNLRNRVSYTFTSNDNSAIGDADGRNAYTFYSYDSHGNVEWVIHDQQANSSAGGNNRLTSKIDYTYDLISGKVNTLTFRVGYNDRFFHRYNYDRNDRLSKVETSRDGVIWDNDGSYEYFKHGPVKRLTIGEDSLQGIDYTYTLQGWLKAINHPSLDPMNDPGGDGGMIPTTTINTAFAKDAYGMTLNYYPGDFRKTLGTTPSLFNSVGTTQTDYLEPTFPLYGGNITSWSEQVHTPTGTTPAFTNQQTGSIFKYDVLQRIKTENFQVANTGTDPTFAPNTSYDTKYSYDGNGNILTLNRLAPLTGGATPIDNLSYNYQTGNNRLDYIHDAEGIRYITDLGDQSASNYNYDATGNLTSDGANGITGITWTPLNKVAQVTKTGGITITYTYDATGKCILKTVDAPGTADDKSTSYVYDAAGQQLLAVYEKSRLPDLSWSNPMLKEAPIYGSSRLGMMLPNEDRGPITGPDDIFTRTLEKKNYELTDHLGNVRSVITDMKLPDGNDGFLPEATTRNYYYPFGMERPLMTATVGGNDYRFGYSGKEKMDDIYGKGNALDFGARILDTRVGKWFSTDFLKSKYPYLSPYNYVADNPIALIDRDGNDFYFYGKDNKPLLVVITGTKDVAYKVNFANGFAHGALILDARIPQLVASYGGSLFGADLVGISLGIKGAIAGGYNAGIDAVYFFNGKDAGSLNFYSKWGPTIGLDISAGGSRFWGNYVGDDPKNELSAAGYEGPFYSYSIGGTVMSYEYSWGVDKYHGSSPAGAFWPWGLNEEDKTFAVHALGGVVGGIPKVDISASWSRSDYKHLFSTDDLLTKFDLGKRLSTEEWEGLLKQLKQPYIEIGPIKRVPPEKGDTDECGNNEQLGE